MCQHQLSWNTLRRLYPACHRRCDKKETDNALIELQKFEIGEIYDTHPQLLIWNVKCALTFVLPKGHSLEIKIISNIFLVLFSSHDLGRCFSAVFIRNRLQVRVGLAAEILPAYVHSLTPSTPPSKSLPQSALSRNWFPVVESGNEQSPKDLFFINYAFRLNSNASILLSSSKSWVHLPSMITLQINIYRVFSLGWADASRKDDA